MRQFILFFEIVVIISDIIYKSLMTKFQYSGSSTVDKVTVMGNVEDRSGVIVQGFFKYLLRGDVKVVCRFVKN